MGARSAARIPLPSSSLPVLPLRVPVSGTPHNVVVLVVAVPPVVLLLVVAVAVEVTAPVALLLLESAAAHCCRRSPDGFLRLLPLRFPAAFPPPAAAVGTRGVVRFRCGLFADAAGAELFRRLRFGRGM